jgi:hypothetical protein
VAEPVGLYREEIDGEHALPMRSYELSPGDAAPSADGPEATREREQETSALFVAGAAVASLWGPERAHANSGGVRGGCLLGLVGLAPQPARGSLHYTPNRWLMLGITLLVTTRLAFGFRRSWQVWRATPDYASWAAVGAPASLAAGAIVLGHYLTYWLGVRRRLRRHNEKTAQGSGA